MTDLIISRSELGNLTPLAEGGTAFVYRLPNYTSPESFDVVYKQYKKATLKRAGPGLLPGLQSIVDIRIRMADPQRRLLDERAIWPARVVVDDQGAAVGILMRLIPKRFFQQLELPSGGRTEKAREAQFLLMDDLYAKPAGVAILDVRSRVEICAQIAQALGLLHRAEVVFGDISARNVVYDAKGTKLPRVLLVDCDSVRGRGTRSPFGAQAHTPLWWPPEALNAREELARLSKGRPGAHPNERDRLKAQTAIQSKATDVYKFALLVVRILDYGRQRSTNRDQATASRILRQHMGRQAAVLLDRSLDANPHERPTMREWYEIMTGRQRKPARSPAPPPSGRWQWIAGQGWARTEDGHRVTGT